jgi:geranylgeranyl pyrophosphate synthase
VTVDERIAFWRAQVDAALERLLPPDSGPAAKVARAMRYAVLGGGKRLRPCIVLASCEAAGGSTAEAVEAAAAVEMIHAYSLVHDDLPAMDDDDLRRGRPTVHRAFDEATAILAGDGLHSLAFEVLATCPGGAERAGARAMAAAVVARAAGAAGMVGGQQADLDAEGRSIDLRALEWIHRHKTGALLSACAEVGAIHGGAGDGVRAAFAAWGEAVGLAFQIVDDVLDVTSTSAVLGKTAGKDEEARKATYPALLGVEASKRRAALWIEEAAQRLARAGIRNEALERMARQAIDRAS